MRIDLQIDELVLDGITVQDHEGLRTAIAAELARLLAERGVPPVLSRAGDVPALNGDPVTIQPGVSTGSLGGQIALAVYGGLGSE